MKFFFDNTASIKIAHAISLFCGVEPSVEKVIHLQDRWRPDTDDKVWIPELAREGGWAIISGDRFRKSERKIFIDAKLTTFFYSRALANAKLWEQAHRVIRYWPAIMEATALVEPGALFEIPFRLSGRFKPL